MRYNNIFINEKYKNVNSETKLVIKEFMNESRSKGLTKMTIKEYNQLLNYAAMIIYDYFDNKSFLQLKRNDFRDFLLILKDDFKISNSRINSILSVLTSCLNYAADIDDDFQEYLKNPLRSIKRLPKILIKEKVFLTRDEVKKIIKNRMDTWNLQDAVLISLAYDSAARISELVQIKKTDILDSNFTNTIVRKGQKKKSKLIFMNDTKKIIKIWLDLRGDDDIEDLFIYPNFPTRSNSHLKRKVISKTLSYRINKICKEVLNKDISPHVFRRSRAEGLKKGEDERFNHKKFFPREIQLLLGHSNLSTTEIYLKDDSEEVFNNILELIN